MNALGKENVFLKPGFMKDVVGPSFTPEMVSSIAAEVMAPKNIGAQPLQQNTYKVVEINAARGKLTDYLVKRLPLGTRYLAMENNRQLLDVLDARKLPVISAMAPPHVVPVPNACVENVVCHTNFGWVSHPQILEEVRRVMVPGGSLILVYNKRQYVGWMELAMKQFEELRLLSGGVAARNWIDDYEWRRSLEISDLFQFKEYKRLAGVELRGSLLTMIEMTSTNPIYKVVSAEARTKYLQELYRSVQSLPGIDVDNVLMPLSGEFYVFSANPLGVKS